MSWRTVIVSKQSKLDYKMGYMVVRNEEIHRILIDEVAILLIENPAVSLTGCLIEKLIEKKVRVVFCDSTRSPVEIVSTLEKNKLFILLNLRNYITDQDSEGFLDSVLSHGYNIFMIETCDHKRLQKESRIIVDNDLCVIKA